MYPYDVLSIYFVVLVLKVEGFSYSFSEPQPHEPNLAQDGLCQRITLKTCLKPFETIYKLVKALQNQIKALL